MLGSIDMRNVNESLDSGFSGKFGQPSCAVNVNVVESKVAGLELATDQVEDDVGVSYRFSDRLFVSQVKRRKQDLAQIADDSQSQGVVVVAAVGDDNLQEMGTVVTFVY